MPHVTADAADWTDSPTSWWRPATTVLAVTAVVAVAFGVANGRTSAWAVAYTGVAVALIALVTSISTRSYGYLRLTDHALMVGRHRYGLDELDPAVLRAQTMLGRPLRVGEQGPDGLPVPRPRSAAGAWSPPFGVRSLLVRTRGGQWLAVATSDPMRLLAELVRRSA
jgi:hypothetical protein